MALILDPLDTNKQDEMFVKLSLHVPDDTTVKCLRSITKGACYLVRHWLEVAKKEEAEREKEKKAEQSKMSKPKESEMHP